MLKILVLLVICIIHAGAYADDDYIDKVAEACAVTTDMFHALAPVVSFPPVVGGELQRTAYADLCNVVVELRELKYKLKTLNEKTKGFDLTKSNSKALLALGIALGSSLSSRINNEDVNKKSTQKAAMDEQYLDSYYKKITGHNLNDPYSNHMSADSALEVKANHRRFSELTQQKAIYDEITSCPYEYEKSHDNIKQSYDKELKPLIQIRSDQEKEKDFYYDELSKLSYLNEDVKNLEGYDRELSDLEAIGIQMNIEYKTQDVIYYVTRYTKNEPQRTPVKEKATYQVFTPKINSQMFENFKTKWSPNYKDHLKQTNSFLDDVINIFDNCSPTDQPNYDFTNPSSAYQWRDYHEGCSSTLKSRKGMLTTYNFSELLEKYKISKLNYAKAHAAILTFESKILLSPILAKDNLSVFKTNINACEPVLTVPEMKNLSIRQEALENEYRLIYAKTLLKNNKIDEYERAQMLDNRQKQEREFQFLKQKAIKEKNDLNKVRVIKHDHGL